METRCGSCSRECSEAGCTTGRQLCARWFKWPQGAPSGVCTGQRKPQVSGSSLRTVVVFLRPWGSKMATKLVENVETHLREVLATMDRGKVRTVPRLP